ncbi:MAG: hypothetical protein H7834_05500 [Magnetococcus sp. YQC-9]
MKDDGASFSQSREPQERIGAYIEGAPEVLNDDLTEAQIKAFRLLVADIQVWSTTGCRCHAFGNLKRNFEAFFS